MSRRAYVVAAAALAASAVAVALRTREARSQHPPLGRLMEVDGVRLHYLEAGSGEPIVLLHGNGSLIQDFAASDLVRLLAQTHRVIVFDRPGYGYSDRPRGRSWSPAAQAELLAKAAARLGAERVHLLGHSWGTLVALEWALRRGDGVRSLTLASGYYFPTPRLDVVLASGPAVPLLGDLMRFTLTPLLARLAWPGLLRKLFGPAPTPKQFREVPRALVLAPLALRASAEESAAMIPAASALTERYRDLDGPVLIVTGDGDRIVDHRRQSRRLHDLLPQSRLLVLEGSGHMVHHLEPRRIAEAVLAQTRPASA
ncbi:alpha/beta hydrolase [Aureimonas endophytica]|uniref:Alpha/beta hydrolase n=1 Tax=Aureimonas endophytica TaxID=2027858 RepID=A0A916ZRA1_9HYPH|nr:alpha/beta hydrolase [Aureimonas endophytica]GGE10457.1 alpha/beta hydrolase [Aureimonas endophytica]